MSEARLRANRANARKSTGPKSAAGKARVAQNALRHGLLAQQVLVGEEDPGAFQAVCQTIFDRFKPADGFEYHLLEELAAHYWRMRRCWALETECLANAISKETGPSQMARLNTALTTLAAQPKLPLLHRYEARLNNMFHRAMRDLNELQRCRPDHAPGPLCPPIPELPNKPITPMECNESPIAEPTEPIEPAAEEPTKPTEDAPEPARTAAIHPAELHPARPRIEPLRFPPPNPAIHRNPGPN